ncbi:MAG TPA: ABC transporter permease [Candidatus Angelobacter sp.]|nr:ABC transporter permease [Candidatus Angelobacter sp.]
MRIGNRLRSISYAHHPRLDAIQKPVAVCVCEQAVPKANSKLAKFGRRRGRLAFGLNTLLDGLLAIELPILGYSLFNSGGATVESLFQDVRYAVRTLLRTPGFAAVAVLTIALGIGANSTIFSWVNSTLLHPLPGVGNTEGLVALTRAGKALPDLVFSYPDYEDLRTRAKSFAGLAAYKGSRVSLTSTGKAESVWVLFTSANYFDVLDAPPMLGRGFTSKEDGPNSDPVAVISYNLWQTHFGGNQSVIGQTIHINQHPYSIVGVTPPRFQGSQTGLSYDLWIPMEMGTQLSSYDPVHQREVESVLLFGRLKPSTPIQQAEEETKLAMTQIAEQYPGAHQGKTIAPTLEPIWRSSSGGNRLLMVLLPMLMAIAGIVLLLACANVANLLLVRSIGRRREMAIRLSIGASRWRLIRQHLVESMVVALTGGAVALLFTLWTSGSLAKFIPQTNAPISLIVRTDRTVLLATFGISIFAAMVFGILPALRSSNLTPIAVLKDETGGASGGLRKARLASGLVAAQLSLSLLLLVCAGLFIRSFQKAQHFDPGFNPNHVLLACYDLHGAGYGQSEGLEFNRKVLAKLESLPGVQAVTMSNWVPLSFTWNSDRVSPEGYTPQSHEQMSAASFTVTPGYFRALQIPLSSGRDFSTADTKSSEPVVVVNQELADRYWPHQDAIGKKIGIGTLQSRVIGVTRNSNIGGLNEAPQPALYQSEFQQHSSFVTLNVRVAGDPMAFAPTVEKAVQELNPNLPVFDVRTLQSQVQLVSMTERIAGAFVGSFGLLALILAAVGIYGVIAYTTRQRTREIGIRIALGARRVEVLRLVLGQGLRLTAIGLAVGLVLSVTLTRFLTKLLFGVAPTDLPTFLLVAAVLSLVALAACFLPAQRATRVDPMVVLRYE